jgi:hypothetical protein
MGIEVASEKGSMQEGEVSRTHIFGRSLLKIVRAKLGKRSINGQMEKEPLALSS